MRSDWKTYLADLGANFDDDHVESFGDPIEEAQAALQKLVICDLSHMGVIKVSGKDAFEFLQSQFCNDLKQVTTGTSQLNAYANPKGRLIAVFRVYLFEQSYFLLMPQSITQRFIQHLTKFVMRAKLTIELSNNELGRIGISGEAADNLIAAHLCPPPEQDNEVLSLSDINLLKIPGVIPRYILLADHRRIYGVWSQLMNEAQPVGEDAWGLLDIESGIPQIFPETQESFIPQMLNLDCLQALSFDKGCYPGQEIIARIRYLGKLKRRMYLFRCPSQNSIAIGSPIYETESSNPQSIGEVVDIRPHPQDGLHGLAVIQIDRVAAEDLCLAEQVPIQLLPLPYSIPNENEPVDS